MARYLGDQNKVIGIHESGTYATVMAGSSFWMGQVQSHTIDENENKNEVRYFGTGSRTFADFELGQRDVTGTIKANAQDIRLLAYAIGSVTVGSAAAAYTNTITSIGTDVRQSAFVSGAFNPAFSFGIEDSKLAVGTGRNFIRTIKGCIVNTATLTVANGEKATIDADYIGQTAYYTSGASTAVTRDSRPAYLYSDATLTMFGSVIQTLKEVTIEVSNNLVGPHYLNGSRDISVPFLGTQDVTMTVSMDMESETIKPLYDQYYKAGSTFNATLDLNKTSATGSMHAIIILSGCYITSCPIPSELEGTTESSIEIRPQYISAVEYTDHSFNPW